LFARAAFRGGTSQLPPNISAFSRRISQSKAYGNDDEMELRSPSPRPPHVTGRNQAFNVAINLAFNVAISARPDRNTFREFAVFLKTPNVRFRVRDALGLQIAM
jgi:hypothetical protein